MNIGAYVKTLDTRRKSGIAREHSYRGDLQHLLQMMLPTILVTNEPARIACGAPDYILTHQASGIDIGYIEAKDIGKSLNDDAFSEQFGRYRKSLNNLIFTDYMNFQLFRDGEFALEISIAELKNGRVIPKEENFSRFKSFVIEFASYTSQTITSASVLATMMAAKARLLAQVIEAALAKNTGNEADTSLQEQLEAFKNILIHDINAKSFSDLYAQTIAYGMFAARLQDASRLTFTRQEAAQLVPATNPFLRKLFQYVSGFDIDARIEWIVNALADVFRATNVKLMLKDFGKSTQRADPVIHFYETFLSEYDPALRKSRGVWYTPEPVVRFIVEAVDDILKDDFKLSLGLANTSKVNIKVESQVIDRKKAMLIEKDVHKVQLLDPATGTGTFLAEVTKKIHAKFKGQSGIWSKYVEDHLIPRLNGFELLMASYAVAHLKLDLLLKETGYKPIKAERLHIYLTNSLEEYHPDTGTLFASWLSTEANDANHIKRDTPVMVVLGNPPYSRHSVNKGHWLGQLLDDYKKEPGTQDKLRERNSKWLNDDYVKFIRYAQHFVDKSGYGVVAYITNHGFIDNPTFRGMRWSLLKSFNDIYVIDLHGNSNINERVPEGVSNENVFDIKQGVAITLCVRTGKIGKTELARVRHHDVYGTRAEKYDFLDDHHLGQVPFEDVVLRAPLYYLKNKSYQFVDAYEKWPRLDQIFKKFSTGYYTSCDETLIADDANTLRNNIEALEPIVKYKSERVRKTIYRPFDYKNIYYDSDLMTRARAKFVNSLSDDNIIIITGKSTKNHGADHFFISEVFSELKCGESSKGSYMFPLRIKSASATGDILKGDDCNLDEHILDKYRKIYGKKLCVEDVQTYIYAIMYSDLFRACFAESIRDDFIRIPYPSNGESFDSLAKLGRELFELHTLRHSALDDPITSYPQEGHNRITNLIGKADWEVDDNIGTGSIWVNESQFFADVPVAVWECSIGGYLPAQKWLKDRRGCELEYEDIVLYQRIIVALNETLRIVGEIDEVIGPSLKNLEN